MFYDLHRRRRDGSLVVASSGFPQASDDWEPLPNMSLLRIERDTLTTSVKSLTPSGESPPAPECAARALAVGSPAAGDPTRETQG